MYHDGVDEFYVYLKDIPYTELENKGQELLDILTPPFHLENNIFYIAASIGISHYPTVGKTIDDLLAQAEIAMLKVMNITRNSFQIFKPSDATEMVRKKRIEFDMQKALDNEELNLVYQPKVLLDSGKLVSTEALIRWRHPELGPIPPNEFIPIAEETGMIIEIGYWVIYEAVKQTRAWHDLGYTVRTAVNVSAEQFGEEFFASKVLDILYTFGLNPYYLVIEITESVFKNFKRKKKVISKLQEAGVQIALDDFGTGYSSFGVLKEDFVDSIKIDKSFIDNIPDEKVSSIIASTMVNVGKELDLTVIAEGVETKEQATYLIEIGCNYGQGYLFSRPVSGPKILEYIKAHGCTC